MDRVPFYFQMGDEIEFDIFNLEKTPSPQKPESNVKQNLNECDDSEGYFIQVAGQVINGYTVISLLGKGVFSTVVKAELNGKCFAIKIIRNNALMQKAALKEIEILSKLKSRNIISLDCNFTHRNHVCLVFELMELNLRQVLNKFGKGVGLNIKAVQVYAKQLFVALAQLQEKNVVHADIKPDNIMISENKNLLKVFFN